MPVAARDYRKTTVGASSTKIMIRSWIEVDVHKLGLLKIYGVWQRSPISCREKYVQV
jgi:hypothetical protein